MRACGVVDVSSTHPDTLYRLSCAVVSCGALSVLSSDYYTPSRLFAVQGGGTRVLRVTAGRRVARADGSRVTRPETTVMSAGDSPSRVAAAAGLREIVSCKKTGPRRARRRVPVVSHVQLFYTASTHDRDTPGPEPRCPSAGAPERSRRGGRQAKAFPLSHATLRRRRYSEPRRTGGAGCWAREQPAARQQAIYCTP